MTNKQTQGTTGVPKDASSVAIIHDQLNIHGGDEGVIKHQADIFVNTVAWAERFAVSQFKQGVTDVVEEVVS